MNCSCTERDLQELYPCPTGLNADKGRPTLARGATVRSFSVKPLPLFRTPMARTIVANADKSPAKGFDDRSILAFRANAGRIAVIVGDRLGASDDRRPSSAEISGARIGADFASRQLAPAIQDSYANCNDVEPAKGRSELICGIVFVAFSRGFPDGDLSIAAGQKTAGVSVTPTGNLEPENDAGIVFGEDVFFVLIIGAGRGRARRLECAIVYTVNRRDRIVGLGQNRR